MTKFQAGTIYKSQVMDYQVHAIRKAIFADPVTIKLEVKCVHQQVSYNISHTFTIG